MKRLAVLTISLIVMSASAILMTRSGGSKAQHAEANAPTDVVIAFNTSQVTDRAWYGAASGDVTGNLTVETVNDVPELFRGTWVGATRWQIAAGGNSFTADMRGKINTYNGTLLMAGKVMDGANPGAKVIAQGQIVAINPHRFAGTIRVQP